MTVQEVANSIKSKNKASAPILIAIEGFGGSGKTTTARALQKQLGSAFVISIDDFIIKHKLASPSWDDGPFDLDRLERQVLMPIKNREVVSYQKLIWENDELSKPITIPAVSYIIVEGISSYHPSIAHYYDYKIWIDVPMQVAKERGRARDGSSDNAEYWDLWAQNDLDYKDRYHPEENADFVITN